MIKYVLLFFFFLSFILALPFYSGDIKNHLVWAQSIISFGPMGFYAREFHDYAFPNYPPLAMWLFVGGLSIYNLISQSLLFLNHNNIHIFPFSLIHFMEWENVQIAFLKLPALIAYIGSGWGIYLLLGELKNINFKNRMIVTLSFLANPAVLYLTSIWGQIDLLPIMFLLFATYFLIKKNPLLTFICLTLAVLSKQTVIIYLPIFAFLIYKTFGLKSLTFGSILSLLIFYLAYLPFHTPSIVWPLQLYKNNFSYVAETLSANAINFWGYFANFSSESDKTVVVGLSLQQWGYVISGTFMALVHFRFINKKDFSLEKFLFTLFLITLIYFFFLTRMHERYLAPAIIFITIILKNKLLFLLNLIFLSLLYFVNLYRGLWQPEIPVLKTVAENYTILDILVWVFLVFIGLNLFFYVRGKIINKSF